MPKVLSYTPSWLSRPSPGFDLFSSNSNKTSLDTKNGFKASSNGLEKVDEYRGPQRAVANRNTEVFVVVDNQIRWSDLSMLKDVWEHSTRQGAYELAESAEGGRTYRV